MSQLSHVSGIFQKSTVALSQMTELTRCCPRVAAAPLVLPVPLSRWEDTAIDFILEGTAIDFILEDTATDFILEGTATDFI